MVTLRQRHRLSGRPGSQPVLYFPVRCEAAGNRESHEALRHGLIINQLPFSQRLRPRSAPPGRATMGAFYWGRPWEVV